MFQFHFQKEDIEGKLVLIKTIRLCNCSAVNNPMKTCSIVKCTTLYKPLELETTETEIVY